MSNDPEKQREYVRQWRQNNPDKVRSAQKKWRADHPDKVRKMNRRWREKNKEKTSLYNRRYYAKNRDQLRRKYRDRNRSTRSYNISVRDLTSEQKALRLREYNRAYAICRRTGENGPLADWREKWDNIINEMGEQMSSRKTIYITDESEKILGDAESLSGRINSIVQLYRKIIDDEMPEFSEAEWCAICDANNGSFFDDFSRAYGWANVADFEGLGDKWGIDQNGLVAKMRDLSLAGKIAIIEVVQAFWKSPNLNSVSNAELLAEAGAKVAPHGNQ